MIANASETSTRRAQEIMVKAPRELRQIRDGKKTVTEVADKIKAESDCLWHQRLRIHDALSAIDRLVKDVQLDDQTGILSKCLKLHGFALEIYDDFNKAKVTP